MTVLHKIRAVLSYISEITFDALGFIYLVFYSLYAFSSLPLLSLFQSRLKSLENEVILVIGYQTALLKEICHQLSKTNAKLVIWTGLSESETDFVENLRHEGINATTFEVVFTDRILLMSCAKKLRETIGDVTTIINTLDFNPPSKILNLSHAKIEETVDINLISYFWIAREFLPKMVENNKGHFVSICSPARPSKLNYASVPYIGTRCGIQGFTESLQDEVRHHMGGPDIKFTMVIPSLYRNNSELNYGCDYSPGFKPRFPLLFSPIGDIQLANAIVQGFRRNKEIVYVPNSFGLLFWIENFIPTEFSVWMQKYLFFDQSRMSQQG